MFPSGFSKTAHLSGFPISFLAHPRERIFLLPHDLHTPSFPLLSFRRYFFPKISRENKRRGGGGYAPAHSLKGAQTERRRDIFPTFRKEKCGFSLFFFRRTQESRAASLVRKECLQSKRPAFFSSKGTNGPLPVYFFEK